MTDAIPQPLRAALASVPGWDVSRAEARPVVGGLMNSNWRVRHEGKEYFLKLFGAGSDQFVNRAVSDVAARQASALGISPRVVHFDPVLGFEVIEFLQGYRASTNADFTRKDFLQGAIDLFRNFNSGDKLGITKDVFTMTDEHLVQGASLGAVRPADFDWLQRQYERAKAAFHATGLDLAPCHNDSMPGNFMVAFDEAGAVADMKLIDFEFASNNERAYEIGAFLGEMFADEPTTLEMIERYFGSVRPELVARVWVARAVADIKWGSWAVQQRRLSDWDFDYQKYGIWKYARARVLFDDPRWNMWLGQI